VKRAGKKSSRSSNAGPGESVSRKQPSGESLTWHEVLALHGSRRGIRITNTHATLLVDFGLSLYFNEREGQRIRYEGDGKHGDQTPTGGNAGLLECLETQRPVRLFERTRPGEWFDRGEYRVISAIYRAAPKENRMIFEFTLEPLASALP
jgi:hypothetical protein